MNVTVDVTYSYVSPTKGGTHPDGTEEILAGYVEIESVMLNNVDITKALSREELLDISEIIKESRED